MITPSDFLQLSYTPDLTEGGIAYATRSLPYIFDRMGSSPYGRLRRIVGGVAVELAFRRYLGEQDIPFDIKGASPFTDPDRYDVSLGGHRCDIKSFIISHRGQIKSLRTHPDLLLNAPALVPSDQHTADGHRPNDLYLFAFLTGLTAASQQELSKAQEAGLPVYLLHAMDKVWAKPANWQPLPPLTLKSEAAQILTVEISGQAAGREFLTRVLELPPRTRINMEDDFYAITSIHVNRLPGARVGIHSPYMGKPYIVDPFAWGNIWLYGMDIILTGYISYDEFGRGSTQIPPGSRVFQYSKTKIKNLAIPVSHLKPLPELFERVKDWQAGKT